MEVSCLLTRGLDALSTGVVLLDDQKRLIYANPAMAKLNRRPVELQIGVPGRDLRPDLADQIEPVLASVLRDGHAWSVTVRGTPAGGGEEERAWHVEYVAIQSDQDARYCLGVVRDITEEADLAHRVDAGVADRQKLVQIIEAINLFVAVLDVDGRVREINANALRRSGMKDADEVRGQSFWATPWWAHDKTQALRVAEACQQAALGKPSQIEVVADCGFAAGSTPEGYQDHIAVDCLFRRAGEGEAAVIIVSGFDVTERKRALSAAEAAAKGRSDALATRDRAIATIGHELRNPLAAATMAHELLKSDTSFAGDEGVAETVAMLGRSLSLMGRLVDDLMDFNRLSHGRFNIERRPVDVLEVIRDAIADVAGDAGGHPVIVDPPDADGATHEILGDAGRLRQVVSNLLRNAAQAVGGGKPGVETGVELHVERRETRVVLRIIDRGCGFDAASAERLFEPFQIGGDASTASGGLGLGLPLCRQIVEAHGGTIEAFSAGRGLGATFTVDLPAAL